MKARIALVVVAVSTLIVGAAVAGAAGQGHGGPGGPGHGPHMHGPLGPLGWALPQLDLTDEQERKIDALVEEARPALDALRTQLRDAEKSFRDANPLTKFDEAAIRAHAAARAKLDADLMVGEARLRSAVLGVLTAEQLAELERILADCRGARGPAEPPHPGEHRPR